ncbi:hypothetical protein K440DRAFT_614422 [Wilcoxina mikolae CBS 423.85]|nr:hypothetical protein K440DRAFT_614422 [Wilcoxina mikolae CBS 423.85]
MLQQGILTIGPGVWGCGDGGGGGGGYRIYREVLGRVVVEWSEVAGGGGGSMESGGGQLGGGGGTMLESRFFPAPRVGVGWLVVWSLQVVKGGDGWKLQKTQRHAETAD